jgi:hypothetical protein
MLNQNPPGLIFYRINSDDNYASYTPFDVTSDKETVSSVWTSQPMQWRVDLADQGGSYVYVPPKSLRSRLFITIMIRISDLSRNRYWSLSSVNLTTPVLLPVVIYSNRILMYS